MNDEESRTCLVFGDGGVGKTTLVLEFMHRFLEEDPDIQCEWKPKVISFYTAKKWRWGLDGVQLISAGQPHLLGLLAHLHLLLLSRLPPQDFYRLCRSGGGAFAAVDGEGSGHQALRSSNHC